MTKCLRLALTVITVTATFFTTQAQNVAINNTGATAATTAILDASSTTKGILVPRMDKTEKNAIVTPANALLVYQTGPDSVGFHYYDLPNTQWVYLNPSGFANDTTAWKITGNSNTTKANFLGTTNDTALFFRIKNRESGVIDSISAATALGYQSLPNLGNAGQLHNSAFGYKSLLSNTTGSNNTALGSNTLRLHRTGNFNTAVGMLSMQIDTTGFYNTAIGYNALFGNTKGVENVGLGVQTNYYGDSTNYTTAVGTNAAFYNRRNNTTAVGHGALFFNSYGSNGAPFISPNLEEGKSNTAVGFQSQYYMNLGSRNTSLGYRAHFGAAVFNPTAVRNVAIGDSALAGNFGAGNTAVGSVALGKNNGNQNTAMGDSAMALSDNISSDVAIGTLALSRHTNGGYANTAVGYYSQRDSSKGTFYNTSIGAFSMEFNRIGVYNTGLGLSAMRLADSTSYNTAVGADAMYNRRKNGSNVAVGAFAQRGDSAGYWNTAIGSEAMDRQGFDGTAKGTGFSNVAVGFRALRQLREGIENTAVGVGALELDSSGSYNTAVGRYSSFFNKRGEQNSTLGYGAGQNSDTASFTTFIGSFAGFNNRVHYNTGIGYRAMQNNVAGLANTALGSFSLQSNQTGDNNVAIGYNAANVADTASAVVAIGRDALQLNKEDSNVAIGYRAGRTLGISGSPVRHKEATFIGTFAGESAFASSKNTAIGFRALAQRAANGSGVDYTNGGRNTAIGDSAMAFGVGISNVAIGTQVLSIASGTTSFQGGVFQNVAIGDSAMGNAFTNANNLFDNVAVGYKSGSQLRNHGNVTMGAYSGQKLGNTVWNTAIGYNALQTDTIGGENTVMGTSSFRLNGNGIRNVGVGINSGYNVTSSENAFLGSYAGEGAAGFSTGGANTGVGSFALTDIRSGASNTAVGYQALSSDTSGDFNVAVGRNALFTNEGSDYNTAVGYNSLLQHKRVGFTYNTGFGSFALEQDSSGFQNTGVGTSTFRFNKTGILNTGVGINAGYYQKESNNTFIGGYSGFGERIPGSNYAVDTGNANSGLGAFSLYRIANGSNNVALGYSAMYSDSSGNLNTAVGNGALYSNTGSHNNQAFGWNALYSYNNTLEGYNNAFGDLALENLASGTQNVAMGSWAMRSHTSGTRNTAIGNFAMGSTGTTGSSNTAIGDNALLINNADGNTAVGRNAGNLNTTGTNNTFLGFGANVTTGALTNATAIGYNATVAQSNSLVLGASGTNVGINETSPNARLHIVRSGVSGGTFIANPTLILEDNTSSFVQLSNPTASENGILSGNAVTTIRSGIVFAADSSVFLRSGGNTTRMTIDNTGFVGIANTVPGDLLHVGTTTGARIRIGSLESIEDFGGNVLAINANWVPTTDNARSLGTLANRWTTVFATNGTINTSDARDKENVENLNYGIKDLMKLRPVSYTWKENPQWGKKIGFIAQEVQPVLKEVIQIGELKSKKEALNDDGTSSLKETDKLGIYYSDIIPVAVKAIQEQQTQIEKISKENEALKKKNEQLENDIKAIKAKLGIQ